MIEPAQKEGDRGLGLPIWNLTGEQNQVHPKVDALPLSFFSVLRVPLFSWSSACVYFLTPEALINPAYDSNFDQSTKRTDTQQCCGDLFQYSSGQPQCIALGVKVPYFYPLSGAGCNTPLSPNHPTSTANLEHDILVGKFSVIFCTWAWQAWPKSF